MTHTNHPLSRRDFLKLAGVGLGALAFAPQSAGLLRVEPAFSRLPEFPQGELLGRNCTADTSLQWGGTIAIQSSPSWDSATVRNSSRDEIFPWIKEVAANTVDYNRVNQRWVETPDGYVYAPYLQPCRNVPNVPLTALPEGQAGFWAEVTVPYVDLYLDNPAPVSGWARDHAYYNLQPRLYYQQVMWIDGVRTTDSGTVQYHVNERYANPGDLFWAEGAAFRPLTGEDISPINPDVDPATKKVVVNLNYQTLTCFEGEREVYYCRVSTGAGEGSTPVGEQSIRWKLLSVRMANTSENASYDLPGISWSSLFGGAGLAIHAATAHNDFGFPRSHGCVNCHPDDAKWVFRWSHPSVPLEPGEVVWTDWVTGSTHVHVVDTL